MTFNITKNVSQVDLGVFGKNNLSLEMKFQIGKKGGWELHTAYCYVVSQDGKQSPIQRDIISTSFIGEQANLALDEIKTMTGWSFA
jgi:hypothetical protein